MNLKLRHRRLKALLNGVKYIIVKNFVMSFGEVLEFEHAHYESVVECNDPDYKIFCIKLYFKKGGKIDSQETQS